MKLKLLSLLTLPFLLAAELSATSYRLDPLWTLPPGSPTWLDTANNQRGMAYNPKTDHLLIADRANLAIHIVDAQTGADLGSLNDAAFYQVGNASFPINMIAVDDDGAIYVANLSNSTSDPRVIIYRWESETASTKTVVFGYNQISESYTGADPGLGNIQRWGDTIDARGSGTNVQVLLGTRGNIAAILRPTDAQLTNFYSTVITNDAGAGCVGYTAKFGAGNTFWGAAGVTSQTTPPAGSPLRLFSFDLATGLGTTIRSYTEPPLPSGMAVVTVDPTQNLMAGLSIGTPDSVSLFSIEDLNNNPVLFDTETNATDNPNGQWAGNVYIVTNKLYVLDANNGISAYTINTETNFAPSIIGQPVDVTSDTNTTAKFSVAVSASTAVGYQWYKNTNTLVLNATNSTLILSNLQPSDAGYYRVVVTNSVGTTTSSNAILTVIGGQTNSGGLYLYEPFNYSAGQTLTGKSVGVSQTWSLNGSGSDDSLVVGGNLTISGLVAPTGNYMTNGGSGAAPRLALNTNFSSGTVYYSFAMRIDSLGSLSSGFTAALVNNSNSTYAARLACKATNGGFQLGIARTSTGYIYDPTIYATGQLLFIVGSYTFNPSASDDVVKLWINPASSSFGAGTAPAATVSDTASGSDTAIIDQFTFRQNTTGNTPAIVSYDELRIGTTWASVTPSGSSEPATPPTLSYSSGPSSITVTWPATYTSYVLQSTPTLSSPSWGTVASTVNGTNNTATINFSGSSKFLRLQK